MGTHNSSTKIEGGSCIVEVLEWFNYSHASAYPGCKVSCLGILISTCIVTSLVVHRGQPDSKESCIVLFVASLPSFQSVHCFQYANFVLQVKSTMNEATDRCACEPLIQDVVASKANQNSCSYPHACELGGPTFDSLCKNLG